MLNGILTEEEKAILMRVLSNAKNRQDFVAIDEMVHEQWRLAEAMPEYWRLDLSGQTQTVTSFAASGNWTTVTLQSAEGSL